MDAPPDRPARTGRLTRVKSLRAEPDDAVWVMVPHEWTDETWPDYRDWARQAAETVWGDAPTALRPDLTVDHLALTLAMFVERFEPEASPAWYYLWLPEPRTELLFAQVHLFEAEGAPEEARRELLALDDPDSVEPPVVDEVDNPHLGPGERSLRYIALDPDGDEVPLAVSVRYFWRTDGYDVVLTATTPDRQAALEALPDLDALAASLQLVDQAGVDP